MLVAATSEDLLVSSSITGSNASWLKPSLRANGLDPDNLPDAPERSYDSNKTIGARKWKDVWAAGQGVGAIKAVESVADVVDRLEIEWQAARTRFKEYSI